MGEEAWEMREERWQERKRTHMIKIYQTEQDNNVAVKVTREQRGEVNWLKDSIEQISRKK